MTAKNPALVDGDGLVDQVRDLVETYVKAEVVEIVEPVTNVKALAVRSGNSVTPISTSIFDPYRLEPRYRTGNATMLSIDSLIDHVNRFKDDDSAIFADDDRERPSITAVLDYHRAGADSDPRLGRHRSTFGFPLSDEWKVWTEKNAEQFSMADFAAFLEDRLPDVLALVPGEDHLSEEIQKMVDALGGPDIIATPNKLMELSRGLQVNENAVAQETVNLASGEGVIRFQTEHTDATGAPLRVPKVFMIGIPVFRNGWLYRIAARLRYRKSGGRIIFWFELWNVDRTFDHAFKEAIEHVKTETGLPVFIGTPEA